MKEFYEIHFSFKHPVVLRPTNDPGVVGVYLKIRDSGKESFAYLTDMIIGLVGEALVIERVSDEG